MDDHRTWEVLESRETYDARPWFSVSVQRVRLPDGRVIDNYYQIGLPHYVVIVPYLGDGRLVMLRQYRHGYGKVSLTLPGGILEKGEDPLAAAKRELMEETGHTAAEWQSMGEFVPHSNYGCGKAHFFLARDARPVARPAPGDLEYMTVEIVDEAGVDSAVRSGEMLSLSNVAAIMLARSLYNGRQPHHAS